MDIEKPPDSPMRMTIYQLVFTKRRKEAMPMK
jgi:hypothetical protein